MAHPTTITTLYVWAMGRLDGCPRCVYNTEMPTAAVPTDNGWTAHYECTDCGAAWDTSWTED